MARGGGYFKTTYAADLALVDTRLRRRALAAFVVALLVRPWGLFGTKEELERV